MAKNSTRAVLAQLARPTRQRSSDAATPAPTDPRTVWLGRQPDETAAPRETPPPEQ
jgi:hypothetical protein